MEVPQARCAGLDVHKETVVACARRMIDGKVTREVRTFKTTTTDLPSLTKQLASLGITNIANGGDRGLLEAGLECRR